MWFFVDDARREKTINDAFIIVNKVATLCNFHRTANNEWVRKWGWKTDVIYITRKWISKIDISFAVYIPPIDKSDSVGFTNIAFVNLFYLAGYKNIYLDCPKFTFFCDRYENIVKNSLDIGITWFDDFDTPMKCLEYVHKEQDRGWRHPDSPADRFCEKYLTSLPKELENLEFPGIPRKMNILWEYPNNDSRALFDLDYDKSISLPELGD